MNIKLKTDIKMRKLLFILLFFPAYLWGQSEFSKIQIGVNFSPDYNYRTLKSTGNGFDDVIDFQNGHEVGKFGYTTGISAIYNFSKLIGIEIDVQFSEKGYQTKTMESIVIDPNDPAVPDKWNYRYKYEYIDVPLKANFTFGKKKLRYIATAGFAANFLIDVKSTFVEKYGNETKKQTEVITDAGHNKYNISPIIGAGIDYKINNKISVRAVPEFRYGLIKLYNNQYTSDVGERLSFSEHLWNIGLNVGIYYGFK